MSICVAFFCFSDDCTLLSTAKFGSLRLSVKVKGGVQQLTFPTGAEPVDSTSGSWL